MDQQILNNAQILWNYLTVADHLIPADCILVLGSNDLRSAEYAVELFQKNFAPKIIFSGGFGRLTHVDWRSSEAEVFAQKAVELGVPEDRIYIDSKSTNTAENIIFTQDLIQMHNLTCNSLIVVTKPYMTRRAKAIIDKQSTWKQVLMTAPQIPFAEFPNEIISQEDMINLMVGEVDRLIKYPARGFINDQSVPDAVINAYHELVRQGFIQSSCPN